ncbi:Ankyrin repeat domain-containing protein 54 [Eumeta japonica]|uniref:Ankyrin repeat domain-containing protein 54 n=1 Tax=Eumeta variegata TaxID=151549 RepID=A0A4C2A0U5_EUMVA|nr:Ankyrin repeat domain-containing protein 54 [Eumeta japonica]
MADSGVDTSNESSDNPIFDNSHCTLEFEPPPISLSASGRPIPIEFNESPAHDHVGKIKCSTKARHHRLKCRYSGILCTSRNQKLRFAASTNNTELVEKLLNSGADPNASDEYQRSPLHMAACRGYVDIVKMLLHHGANPNNKDSVGNTPLHLAACTSHIPVVIALLDAGTDVSANDRNGRNPIQIAISKLRLILMRPAANMDDTRKLIGEVRSIVEMMLKYMNVKKEDPGDLESICKRLEKVSTHEQVESEVQNILDSFDSLKLR